MAHALIIEDDILIAMQIEAMLQDLGIASVDIAATEDAAIDCAIAHHPDIITSDVRLAAGHGPHAVHEIIKRIGETPVMFITGSPKECEPCNPPAIILQKPLLAAAFADAYRKLT